MGARIKSTRSGKPAQTDDPWGGAEMSAERNQFQETLADFLRIESQVALTFLWTAAIDTRIDLQHSKEAINKARAALRVIRRFAVRIVDLAERMEIDVLADQLETAINSSGIVSPAELSVSRKRNPN